MEMNNNSCLICGETFNRSKRIRIQCEYCDFQACRTCCETYVLSQLNPHCMNTNCNKEWTRQFMSNVFTSEFMNKKYVKHREEILFEQEKALLPETQPIVERIIYKRNELARIDVESAEIETQMHVLAIALRNLTRRKNDLLNDTYEINVNANEDVKDDDDSKKHFSRKCTNDNCKGFLSSKWKCSLCNTWTCHECHVNVGTFENKQTHVCLKEDVETVKLLKTDSKPCPNCSVLIFKMDGCDQMFCTNCKTAFSWNTGKIYRGRHIHNPHYFEYMRENGIANENNVEDNANDGCQRIDAYISERIDAYLCAFDLVPRVSHNFGRPRSEITSNIYKISRNIIHLKNVIIAEHETTITRCTDHSVTNRIDYMLNNIIESKFKKNIQVNEKKKQKSQEYLAIFTMVYDTVADILNNLYTTLSAYLREYAIDTSQSSYSIARELNVLRVNRIKHKMELNNCNIERIIVEFRNLIRYANNCLDNISRTYKCINKKFTSDFELKKNIDDPSVIVDLTGYVNENDDYS
jgi:hypothetical protein